MDSHNTTSGRFDERAATAPARQQELPRARLTWLLIGANVLIYIAMAIATQNPLAFPVQNLLAWGGNFAPSIYQGELWRPFTAMFLHAGIIHLGMNMWVLSAIGPFMERLFGVTSFLLLYLLAGLAGNILGMIWHPDVVGVGASGAIFGLYGGLMGLLFVRRNAIPADALRALVQNGLYFLGVNLVLGFSIPNVDVAAHLFGALAGFIGGVAASWPVSQTPTTARVVRNILLASMCVSIVAAIPLCVPASAKAHARYLTALRQWTDQEDALLGHYNALVQEHQRGESDGEAFADKLEQEVLEPWSKLHGQFPPPAELPSRLQATPVVPKIYSYLAAMEESFRLRVQANRTGDQLLAQRAAAKLQEAEGIVAQMGQQASGE